MPALDGRRRAGIALRTEADTGRHGTKAGQRRSGGGVGRRLCGQHIQAAADARRNRGQMIDVLIDVGQDISQARRQLRLAGRGVGWLGQHGGQLRERGEHALIGTRRDGERIPGGR